jgi:NTP pyrophosphatase (non-canonical NTP hydrolase)
MSDIRELTNCLRGFVASREWERYHTPSNLAKSISIEAGELLELFQWEDPSSTENVEKEMADILIYLVMMADVMGIDLVKATWTKIANNVARYPMEKAKGNCKKAEEL